LYVFDIEPSSPSDQRMGKKRMAHRCASTKHFANTLLALAWAEDQQHVQSGVGDQRNFGKGLL
jgi:hypothetical protein